MISNQLGRMRQEWKFTESYLKVYVTCTRFFSVLVKLYGTICAMISHYNRHYQMGIASHITCIYEQNTDEYCKIISIDNIEEKSWNDIRIKTLQNQYHCA